MRTPNFIPPRLTPQQQELLNRPTNTKLDIVYNKHQSSRIIPVAQFITALLLDVLIEETLRSDLGFSLSVALTVATVFLVGCSLLICMATVLREASRGHCPTQEADLSNVFPLGRSGYVAPPQGGSVIASTQDHGITVTLNDVLLWQGKQPVANGDTITCEVKRQGNGTLMRRTPQTSHLQVGVRSAQLPLDT